MTPIDDVSETMERAVETLSDLVSGNPEPYKALWSQAQDVTVLGGFGGYALGWDQVRENTEWAASRFHGAKSFGIKLLAKGASGDLAYAVWIEHGEVRVQGRDDYVPIVVRVTHIFRREDGAWKIIHRHGDPVVEKTEATAILQR
jgi:ketosteroid isomerase-like protein